MDIDRFYWDDMPWCVFVKISQHHVHNYGDSSHSKADHPAIDATKCHWFH